MEWGGGKRQQAVLESRLGLYHWPQNPTRCHAGRWRSCPTVGSSAAEAIAGVVSLDGHLFRVPPAPLSRLKSVAYPWGHGGGALLVAARLRRHAAVLTPPPTLAPTSKWGVPAFTQAPHHWARRAALPVGEVQHLMVPEPSVEGLPPCAGILSLLPPRSNTGVAGAWQETAAADLRGGAYRPAPLSS